MADAIKRFAPIPIVFGGVHPTVDPVEVLGNSSVDFVVLGEGEHSFMELLHCLLSNMEVGQARGIGHKEHGRITVNSNREPIADINSLPFPAYDLLPVGFYARQAEPDVGFRPLDMVVSRGCPFWCSFCAASTTQGKRVRLVGTKSLVAEIGELLRVHPVEGVWFKDSNFTIDKDWVTGFCDEVRSEGLDFPWACNTRVDLVDEATLDIMKAAGLTKIWFGVESGSVSSLKTLSKGFSLDRIRSAFRTCRQLGVQTGAFFMIGIPGEKMEDIRANVALAKELEANQYRWHVFVPLPGSRLFDLYGGQALGSPSRFDRASTGTGYLTGREIEDIYQKICSHFYDGHPLPNLD
ncbi:MAG: radical SAM protein [Chloroflexi bacterium]|nr:radical SAM protein [Chloroflexota bacterium]